MTFDVDDRVNASEFRMSFDDRLPVVALKRGEAHGAFTVVVEYQLHRLVAEAAHAVVEQDGRAGGSFYHEFAFSRSGGLKLSSPRARAEALRRRHCRDRGRKPGQRRV